MVFFVENSVFNFKKKNEEKEYHLNNKKSVFKQNFF